MNKHDYLAKSYKKISHKVHEHRLIFNIVESLNKKTGYEVKPIFQQLVRKSDGKRYLLDLYFPQFKIYVEINEPYHLTNKEEDCMRESHIEEEANLSQRRIEFPSNYQEIPDFHLYLDKEEERIVNEIVKLREEHIKLGVFKPWDPSKEGDVKVFLEKGILSIYDDAYFKCIKDCHRLTGKPMKEGDPNRNKNMHGSIFHMVESDVNVFPASMFNSGGWINSLSSDGLIFTESLDSNSKRKWDEAIEKRRSNLKKGRKKHFIFLREKDSLGGYAFRFVGVFEIDFEESEAQKKIVYKRIGTEIRTYNEKEANKIVKEREEEEKRKKKEIREEKKAATAARWAKFRQEKQAKKEAKAAIRAEKIRAIEEARANRVPSKRGRKPKMT